MPQSFCIWQIKKQMLSGTYVVFRNCVRIFPHIERGYIIVKFLCETGQLCNCLFPIWGIFTSIRQIESTKMPKTRALTWHGIWTYVNIYLLKVQGGNRIYKENNAFV